MLEITCVNQAKLCLTFTASQAQPRATITKKLFVYISTWEKSLRKIILVALSHHLWNYDLVLLLLAQLMFMLYMHTYQLIYKGSELMLQLQRSCFH